MAVLPIAVRDRAALNRGMMPAPAAGSDFDLITEENFLFALSQERKRSDRSGRPFLLVLLARQKNGAERSGLLVEKVIAALRQATRETDTAGWYERGAVMGALFTELPEENSGAVQSILGKITSALNATLEVRELDEISITCHLYPQSDGNKAKASVKLFFRPAAEATGSLRARQMLKRAVDVVGSLAALVVLSPLFLLAALAVRWTSEGPVFFRQTRIGQFGKSFTFLKFRSMVVNNDASIHKEYVTQLIQGKGEKHCDGGEKVYKITNDPRVTAVGRFLRRTSLDELPQFLNVLRGEMSLVGPRPPLPYEFECYGVWHRRRVFEVKPGITGLWQVSGRSRTNFDDMVRLDLTYVRTWSIWLDLFILVRTPWAMVSGAY